MSANPEKKQIFHEFCEWLKMQPGAGVSADERLKQYAGQLHASGTNETEIESRLGAIRETLFKIDVERWNRFYAGNEQAAKEHPPNKFMTGIVSRLAAGTALDIGMGQGRNALYLAGKGWETTGLEASAKGVAAAIERARMHDLKLTAVETDYERYDWGKGRWDLILLLYVPLKNIAERVVEGLSPNGRLIVETYLDEARSVGTFGDKVTLSSNELTRLFASLNIYVYEELTEANDFADERVPIVRLYAGRPPER